MELNHFLIFLSFLPWAENFCVVNPGIKHWSSFYGDLMMLIPYRANLNLEIKHWSSYLKMVTLDIEINRSRLKIFKQKFNLWGQNFCLLNLGIFIFFYPCLSFFFRFYFLWHSFLFCMFSYFFVTPVLFCFYLCLFLSFFSILPFVWCVRFLSVWSILSYLICMFGSVIWLRNTQINFLMNWYV